MFRYLLCIIMFLAVVGSAGPAFAADVYSLVRVDLRTETDIVTVRSLHLDLVYQGDDYVDVVIKADKLNILDDAGLSYSIEIEDMTGFYKNRLAADKEDGVGSMGGYRTLAEIYLAMDSIANEYPDIVQPKWSIGLTLEGRDIFVMKISDNPEVDEDEPEIYYNATIHAREVITPEVLIRFMRYVTDNYGSDPNVDYIVNNREMFFTLCQNPDGYYRNEEVDPDGGGMWRKNRRDNGDGTWGVDLNRNYGYMWGFNDDGSSPDGSSEVYRGTGPFSEPESQVIRDFILSRDIKVVIAYHSWTNAILWPWGFSCSPTLENDLFSAVGQVASQFNGYFIGFCCGINGYTGDWYYGEETEKPKIYEFLVEVGGNSDGFWPALSRITPLVEENIQPNIIYAKFAGDTTFLLPPAAPTLESIDDITSNPFVLNWSHQDDVNPAVGYDIWQYRGFERITDDLEPPTGNWTSNGFNYTTAKSHSGLYSYRSGNSSSSDVTLTSLQTTTVIPGDSIKFWIWYDLMENMNYGYVEVRTDEQDWTSIPGNITTSSNPSGYNLGHGITGTSGGWIQGLFDIGSYDGQEITFRFRYVSMEMPSEGLYVDDIYPVDRWAEELQIVENHPDSSLTVDVYEDDLYYFQVVAVDAESQRSVGSEIQSATATLPPPWLPGDADASGEVDIDDVVYLIEYIFSSGPAPEPIEVGDADCSGEVDIDDVVYLINYIFSGGPEPCSESR